jgi:hypothetical protein
LQLGERSEMTASLMRFLNDRQGNLLEAFQETLRCGPGCGPLGVPGVQPRQFDLFRRPVADIGESSLAGVPAGRAEHA